MKNIVFVIADMGMGGAQRVVSLLAERLSSLPDYRIGVVIMGEGIHQSFFPLPSSVRITPLNAAQASSGFFAGICANILRIRKLRHALNRLEPDCVVSFQTETNCIALISMMGSGIPVIVSERSDPYLYPNAKIWRLIRRIVYPLASGAVFQTAHAARFFDGLIKDRAVIFNPVNACDAASSEVQAGPYILGVGRLSPEKGFDDLIAAHAIARKAHPELNLVLVGDGPERAALENMALRLGTRESVFFAGARRDLAAYYNPAEVFILPSRYEGLPNALLEAMAQGCAVVSTPMFAAAPEIITHGRDGLIAADGSPEALAREVLKIYENKSLKSELSAQAKISAARFESKKVAGEWIDFINIVFPI
ncbi:MAG TPA: hypothetical protein DEA55_03120 [Rhodospirillaceae bacterium]|nr:hypothetical protein [Rhodospirillaceae bacterium]